MVTNNTTNPWKGLEAYETSDQERFFGRDGDIRALCSLIEYDQVVTLYGKSGVGKTSLLKAGVIPHLSNDDYFIYTIRLNECDKFDYYAKNILLAISNDIDMDCSNKDIFASYFASHGVVNRYGEYATAIIILDQFEEILINSPEKAKELLFQIAEWKKNTSSIISDCHFIISIREDDLYLLEEMIDKYRLYNLRGSRYRLRGISHEGAEKIVRIPGKDFIKDDDAVNKILSMLCKDSSNEQDRNYEASELSLFCSQLYVRIVENMQSKITAKLVEENGINSIKEYYKLATKDLNEKSRIIIEDELVTEDGRRSFMSIDRFNKLIKNETVRQSLLNGNCRILTRSNNRIEVIHDTLARAIKDVKEERYQESFQTRKKRAYFLYIISLLPLYAPLVFSMIKYWPFLSQVGCSNRIPFVWEIWNFQEAKEPCLILLASFFFLILGNVILYIFLRWHKIIDPELQKSGLKYGNSIAFGIILLIAAYIASDNLYINVSTPDYMWLYFSLPFFMGIGTKKRVEASIFLFCILCPVIHLIAIRYIPPFDFGYLLHFLALLTLLIFYYKGRFWHQLFYSISLVIIFLYSIPCEPYTYFTNLNRIKYTRDQQAVVIEKGDSAYMGKGISWLGQKCLKIPDWPMLKSDTVGTDGVLPIKNARYYSILYPFIRVSHNDKGLPLVHLSSFYDAIDRIDQTLKSDTTLFAKKFLNPIKSNTAKLFLSVMENICETHIKRGNCLSTDMSRIDSIYDICDEYFADFEQRYKTSILSGEEFQNYIQISVYQIAMAYLHDAIWNNEVNRALSLITNHTFFTLYREAYNFVDQKINVSFFSEYDVSFNKSVLEKDVYFIIYRYYAVKLRKDHFFDIERHKINRIETLIKNKKYEEYIPPHSETPYNGYPKESQYYKQFMSRNLRILRYSLSNRDANLKVNNLYNNIFISLIEESAGIQNLNSSFYLDSLETIRAKLRPTESYEISRARELQDAIKQHNEIVDIIKQ